MDYLKRALQTFNGGDWYGWKKIDSDGNKIPTLIVTGKRL